MSTAALVAEYAAMLFSGAAEAAVEMAIRVPPRPRIASAA
jgi:hypothetical protein